MSDLVYHSTGVDFDRLDHDRSGLGTHFGTREAASARAAMRGRHLEGRRVHPRVLRAERPLVARDVGAWDDLPTVEAELRRLGALNDEDFLVCRWQLDGAAAWAFLRRKIEEAGYDCVAYRNELEDVGSVSYVVWNDDLIGGAP